MERSVEMEVKTDENGKNTMISALVGILPGCGLKVKSIRGFARSLSLL